MWRFRVFLLRILPHAAKLAKINVKATVKSHSGKHGQLLDGVWAGLDVSKDRRTQVHQLFRFLDNRLVIRQIAQLSSAGIQ